jgi:hypothetical protein
MGLARSRLSAGCTRWGQGPPGRNRGELTPLTRVHQAVADAQELSLDPACDLCSPPSAGEALLSARRAAAGPGVHRGGEGGHAARTRCPDPTSALAALSGHLCVALMRRSGAMGPAASFCQGESSVATLTLGSLAARGGGGTGRGTWLLGQKQVLRPHQRAHRTTTTLARLAGAQELS